MSTDSPTRYYRVHVDTDTSDVMDDVVNNDEGYPRALTGLEVDPYDTGDPESWSEEEAARASDDEHRRWATAHAAFSDTVRRAEQKLEAARAAWEQAQGVYRGALEDAWRAYAPTDEAIGQRVEEVRQMRRQREQEEHEARARAAQEAKDREDAELGPRTWVTYHPNISEVKVAPDMMVPVIHLAGCSVTKGREDSTYRTTYRYARKAQVQETLLEGAPRYERGRATTDRLPTKLCGRCKPHESLRQALGTVYETWQEERDKQPLPMPPKKRLAAALKLTDEWTNHIRPGYSLMSDTYYREEKLVRDDEVMVGWYDPDKDTIVGNEEALERLVQILPERGYLARRVKEPKSYRMGDVLSEYGVAVRRLSVYEQRRILDSRAPAAPGNTVDLEGGPAADAQDQPGSKG